MLYDVVVLWYCGGVVVVFCYLMLFWRCDVVLLCCGVVLVLYCGDVVWCGVTTIILCD